MAKRSYVSQLFTVNGRPKTLSEIASFVGMPYQKLYNRVKAGYTISSGHALVPTLHHYTLSQGLSLVKIK